MTELQVDICFGKLKSFITKAAYKNVFNFP